ncbi:MAG TPA: response regulator [Nitrososphaera sp.]|nr:response regulator [Nitrososphaera sp.]
MSAKIILVDDETDILTVMKKGLSSYPVTSFSDPRAALNALKNNPTEYCILVTDLRMPGLTGFELAREAKKLNPDILVVLMTAFEINLSEFNSVFPSTRIDGTLHKPFRIAELQSTISHMLAKLPADTDRHGGPEK